MISRLHVRIIWNTLVIILNNLLLILLKIVFYILAIIWLLILIIMIRISQLIINRDIWLVFMLWWSTFIIGTKFHLRRMRGLLKVLKTIRIQFICSFWECEYFAIINLLVSSGLTHEDSLRKIPNFDFFFNFKFLFLQAFPGHPPYSR
jgi:hypothetical protein